jgi:DNA-binding beta-propeller fold protein YncE
VSSSTQSITIDITPHLGSTPVTGFPVTENLTSTSPGCTSTQSGTVCTMTLTLTPGAYDATLTTFDGTNGTGNQLSAAQDLPFTVVLNQSNTIPLVLGGILASMQLVAGAGVTAQHLSVFTLAGNASGALEAYGIDADGNTIIGAGGPAVTATTSDATQITVAAPTANAPNTIGMATLNNTAIAHITATVTPATGNGSPLSQTVTVQASSVPLLYIASNQGHVFDLTGTEITPAASAFATVFNGPGGEAIAYNPNNGFLYVSAEGVGSSSILAFDRSGNQQTLNAATTGLPAIGGMVLDPDNDLLYAAFLSSESFAFDASGNAHPLSATLPFTFGITFDPQHHVIVDGTGTYDATGSLQSTLPFTGQIDGGVAYNAYNGWFYVATVYPTMVLAYDTSGNPQTLTGTFLDNSTEQIGAITADPVTGNIYLATNARKTYGFDHNGNPLPPPWHDIIGVGAGSGAAGLGLIPP